MKQHTLSYKNNIKEQGRELDIKITYGNITLDNEVINSINPRYQGALLKSVMKELEIDSNVSIPKDTEINFKFGISLDNSPIEYLDFGNYIVKDIEKQEDSNSYLIKCYDKLLYSMKPYESLDIQYPCKIREYINALCTKLNLNFKNKADTFVNYDKIIPNELYLDVEGKDIGYKYRDVFDELAQVTASTICLDVNDNVEIRYINETNDTIDEEYLKDVNVNFGEKFGPINSVVLSRNGEDNIYRKDEISVQKNGLYEIKITDNQIMNFNNRDEYIDNIYNKLKGIEYYLNDFSSTGITYYDLLDKYSVKIENKTYNCIMFNDNIEINQGLVENINTEKPEESQTDYSKADKTDRRINQTYRIVDKQNQTIKELITKTDGNTTQILQINKSLEGVNTKLSQTTAKTEKLDKDLASTNQTIATNQANFEDFKTNEYMQSIGNLQDQIDGAIQFWNGAEIPTLNNYPANMWKTENDRINHTADIYTVIKDVNGQMKQGKGYRFDKVGGTWQWVELTDNELSAVQAIADEANKRSQANSNSIKTLEDKNVQVDLTLDGIKTEVSNTKKEILNLSNSIENLVVDIETNNLVIPVNNNNIPFNTASFDIAFTTKYAGKLVSIIPTTTNLYEGIKVNTTNNKITFSVNNTTAILKLDNIYKFNFVYQGNTIIKTIVISLAKQGNQGPIGPQGNAGPQGPQGIPGKNGANGKDGQPGKDGVNGKDGKDVAIQSTIPPTDKTQMWYDINTNTLKRWNGTIWEIVNDFSQEIDDINNNLKNNYYTKKETNSQIEQTDTKITNQITEIEKTVSGDIKAQDTKISKVEQTVVELSSQIKDIADLTEVKESSNGVLEFQKVNQSEPININIKPLIDNITYLYPRENLYPSENLFMTDRKLRFTNITDGKIIDYILPDDLLYYNSQNYDEFILDYELRVCKIIKRIGYNANGTTYILPAEQVINCSYPLIELTSGDYRIELLGYNRVNMTIRLMSQNIYTTQFSTKAETNSKIDQKANEIDLSVNKKLGNYSTTTEMNSAINQKADSITSSVSKSYATKGELNTAKTEIKQTTDSITSTVSKKVGDDEVVSKINQSPEQVKINSNKFSLERKSY